VKNTYLMKSHPGWADFSYCRAESCSPSSSNHTGTTSPSYPSRQFHFCPSQISPLQDFLQNLPRVSLSPLCGSLLTVLGSVSVLLHQSILKYFHIIRALMVICISFLFFWVKYSSLFFPASLWYNWQSNCVNLRCIT
jgi:hypothetical protein